MWINVYLMNREENKKKKVCFMVRKEYCIDSGCLYQEPKIIKIKLLEFFWNCHETWYISLNFEKF
jgi:hypothetical protein